jgi:hypothetical protein
MLGDLAPQCECSHCLVPESACYGLDGEQSNEKASPCYMQWKCQSKSDSRVFVPKFKILRGICGNFPIRVVRLGNQAHHIGARTFVYS